MDIPKERWFSSIDDPRSGLGPTILFVSRKTATKFEWEVELAVVIVERPTVLPLPWRWGSRGGLRSCTRLLRTADSPRSVLPHLAVHLQPHSQSGRDSRFRRRRQTTQRRETCPALFPVTHCPDALELESAFGVVVCKT